MEASDSARRDPPMPQREQGPAFDQMISGVAHELNNPLAVIQGYVELILSSHTLDQQTRADLEKVALESDRAAKLLETFLSFLRAQSEDSPPLAAPKLAQEPALNQRPVCKPARILILDDETAIAELLGEIIATLGHQTTLCTSAPQALRLLEDQEFDLVISDFRMPNMDGRQFYKLALAKKPEISRRIIFLTGDTISPDTQFFLKSIGNPHLAKPFRLQNVEQLVNRVLSQNESPVEPEEIPHT